MGAFASTVAWSLPQFGRPTASNTAGWHVGDNLDRILVYGTRQVANGLTSESRACGGSGSAITGHV